jgi:hypothetical protein
VPVSPTHTVSMLPFIAAACWNTIDTWSSCGGNTNCKGGGPCDAPWRGSCCKPGDVCSRQSKDWWRCEPMDFYTSKTSKPPSGCRDKNSA